MGGVAAGTQVLGGILGNSAAKKARAQAAAMAAAAAAQYDGIIPPDVKEQLKQQFTQQGIYTPELEEAINAAPSSFEQVEQNDGLKTAQMEALGLMRQRARVGITPEDRAKMNALRNEVERDSEAKRQQIIQNMQARGLGGSGAELAMMLQGQQESADRASQQADNLGAMASQNALQSLSDYSSTAGNLQSQDVELQKAKAAASDEMNRFNVGGQRNVEQRNTGASNQGQAANLAEKQRIADSNINRTDSLTQQEYQNKLSLAAGKAAALTGGANAMQQQGDAKAQAITGVASGVGSALAAIAAKNSANKPAGIDAAGGTTDFSKDYLARK